MRPQGGELLLSQLEHATRRKTHQITPDLLVETLGWHPIQLGQIGIQQHLLTPDHKNRLCNALDRHEQVPIVCNHG